jgi:hypothetical protein
LAQGDGSEDESPLISKLFSDRRTSFNSSDILQRCCGVSRRKLTWVYVQLLESVYGKPESQFDKYEVFNRRLTASIKLSKFTVFIAFGASIFTITILSQKICRGVCSNQP